MKTVIYHSADFDGLFCREIALKFLGKEDVRYIGWNYGDPKVPVPEEGGIYILDLSPECLAGYALGAMTMSRIVWIDHHKTAMESYRRAPIPCYCIDGVAACRLAWQWFARSGPTAEGALPEKAAYLLRAVSEPLAVRLAGEYDVWDKRDPAAERFQHGLRSVDLDGGGWWQHLLSDGPDGEGTVEELLDRGEAVQYAQRENDASLARQRSFELEWEGRRFLCLNTARCNSLTFAAAVRPEHDGLLGYYWNGRHWTVSLYGAPGKPDADLAVIAVKYGGGGHRQACGFTCEDLPWDNRATKGPEPL